MKIKNIVISILLIGLSVITIVYFALFKRVEPVELEGINYGPFDRKGIPMKEYKWGLEYNPLVVTYYASGEIYFDNGKFYYANGYLQKYKETKKEKYRQAYFRMLDWLEKNGELFLKDSIIWRIKFDFLPYVKSGWYSGLTQGRIAKVFIDAYEFTREEKYLNLARKAINGMLVSRSEGGVFYQDNRGDIWIEEYPSPVPSFVLNGNMSAILNLIDYYNITKDPYLKELVTKLLDSLEKKLPLFDVPEKKISRYDLYGRNQIFGFFSKENQLPKNEHPIDKIILSLPNDPDTILDIGERDDNLNFYSQIISNSSWSDSYFIDGTSVRNFKNVRKEKPDSYRYAGVNLFPTGNIYPGEKIKITIYYKDISKEEICLKIYFRENRQWANLGCLEHTGDNFWKQNTFKISTSDFPNKGIGHLTGESYHKLHINQLKVLYNYSGKEIFKEYTEKWESYLEK